MRTFCELDETGRSLLRMAAQQLQLSARAYHRLLKVARTIADLAGAERIQTAQSSHDVTMRLYLGEAAMDNDFVRALRARGWT